MSGPAVDFDAEAQRLADARKAPTTRRQYLNGNGDPCTALDLVRWRLRLPAIGVVKYGRDLDAEHDLRLDDGESIRLGTARDVLDQARARAAIFAHNGHVVDRVKAPEWDQVAAAIGELAEVIDTGATQDAETRAWLRYFFNAAATRVDDDDRDEWHAALSDEQRCRAVMRGGRAYVHLDAFVLATNTHYRLRVTAQQMSARLARLGFTKRRETASPPGKAQARRVLWHGPDGFSFDEDDAT